MKTLTDKAAVRHGWRTARIAGMASYLDAGALTTTGSAFVLYQSALGIDEAAFGLLAGLLTFCFAVGAAVGGRLGDKYGRRRVFTITLLVYILGVALLAAAVLPAMLYVGVILLGFAIGADIPVSLSLIAEEAPEHKRGRMISLSGVLWYAGILVTSILTILVGNMGELGARIMFGQLLVVAFVVVVLRFRLPESAEWRMARDEAVAAAPGETIRLSQMRDLTTKPIVFSVIALGLFYGMWNLAANTMGQYSTYIWVNAVGVDVSTAGILDLAGVPVIVVFVVIFIRIVDRKSRMRWVAVGSFLGVIAFLIPLIAGLSVASFFATTLLFSCGAVLAGDSIYKVWSQELFPTLLRSTSQGFTTAFARVLAAVFAVITPGLIAFSPYLLFGMLAIFLTIATVIALLWVPKLPPATRIETATTTLEPKLAAHGAASTAITQ